MRQLSATLVLLAAGLTMASAVVAEETAPAPEAKVSAPQLVAYYFHGNFRCKTCRTIEAYSQEAITQGFPEEIASGRMAWRVVNTEESGNEHFEKDFQLTTKSLVLVEYDGTEVVRFLNLTKVWQLVGDKDTFLDYVRESTRRFLEES